MVDKLKCYKFELALAILMTLVTLLNIFFRLDIIKIVNENNCENMVTLTTIFIGIYITLITIIATANIPIATELYRNSAYIKLSNTIKIGLYSNLLLIICLVFFSDFFIVKYIIVSMFFYSAILFMRFINLMIIMYRCNVKDNYEQTNNQRKTQQDLITACKHIDDLLTRMNK